MQDLDPAHPRMCLSGGRTGDGSCLGSVHPRPPHSPFRPLRAGALAPAFDLGARNLFSRPWLESLVPPTPHTEAGWFTVDSVVKRFRPPNQRFGFGYSKYPYTHTALTALETLGEKPDRAISPKADRQCFVRSSPLLRCQAPHLVSRLHSTAFGMKYLAPAISLFLILMFASCFSSSNTSTLAQFEIFVKSPIALYLILSLFCLILALFMYIPYLLKFNKFLCLFVTLPLDKSRNTCYIKFCKLIKSLIRHRCVKRKNQPTTHPSPTFLESQILPITNLLPGGYVSSNDT